MARLNPTATEMFQITEQRPPTPVQGQRIPRKPVGEKDPNLALTRSVSRGSVRK